MGGEYGVHGERVQCHVDGVFKGEFVFATALFLNMVVTIVLLMALCRTKLVYAIKAPAQVSSVLIFVSLYQKG